MSSGGGGGKHQLDKNRLAQLKGSGRTQATDLRSVHSEYDYTQKKTFTDVLPEPSHAQQLARLGKTSISLNPNASVHASHKSSVKSKLSQRSQAKIASVLQEIQRKSAAA